MKKKVVILGAGIAGMAAAEQLVEKAKDDFEITILEKDNCVGGLAASFKINGKYIPKYYHHVFAHDYTTKKYFKKFGLLDKFVWKRIKMGISSNSIIYNFTDPISLLTFRHLSLYGRLRYGLFGIYVFFFMNPDKIPEDLHVKEWLDKYAGKEVTSELFHHLYARNKFNIDLSRISAKQFAFRLKAKEAVGKFGYPKTGLQSFIDIFEKYLVKNKVNILKNTKITKIDVKKKQITHDKNTLDYDYLISTIPLPVFLDLSEGLTKKFKDRVSKIKYCPCVCVVFGTNKLMSKHYWLNLINERAHTFFQHSNLFDGYGKNNKVNWILRYGGSEHDLNLLDIAIKSHYLKIVKRLFPDVKITWSKVFKEKYAEPVYDIDYKKHMPGIRCEDVDGLYFAGTGVSYPKIRNMNSSLETGIDVAKALIEDISSSTE